jgi:hypothetical protein
MSTQIRKKERESKKKRSKIKAKFMLTGYSDKIE